MARRGPQMIREGVIVLNDGDEITFTDGYAYYEDAASITVSALGYENVMFPMTSIHHIVVTKLAEE